MVFAFLCLTYFIGMSIFLKLPSDFNVQPRLEQLENDPRSQGW